MPIIRVNDKGDEKSEGKVVSVIGVVGVVVSVVLYVSGLPDLAIYTCVLAGTICSSYNSFAKV